MKKAVIAFTLILILFLLTGCGQQLNKNELAGVTLTTELEYYAVGTKRILAFWENNSEIPIMYGEPWQLEKFDFDKEKWSTVRSDLAFILIGYDLLPGKSDKHTYGLSIYDDNIAEGRYRIRTDFHDSNITGNGLKSYNIFAEFNVTSDKSLIKKSELDYDDLENSREIPVWPAFFSGIDYKRSPDFPVRVYKNKYTFDTTIVINGEDYYSIAEGTGSWGVVTCNYLEDGDDKYLIYSYSREDENKVKISYIGIFDLISRKEIFLSEPFLGFDITVNALWGTNFFSVAFMTYFEDENGGSGSSFVRELGYLEYADGKFNLSVH